LFIVPKAAWFEQLAGPTVAFLELARDEHCLWQRAKNIESGFFYALEVREDWFCDVCPL
jgi:hypothetical protein